MLCKNHSPNTWIESTEDKMITSKRNEIIASILRRINPRVSCFDRIHESPDAIAMMPFEADQSVRIAQTDKRAAGR